MANPEWDNYKPSIDRTYMQSEVDAAVQAVGVDMRERAAHCIEDRLTDPNNHYPEVYRVVLQKLLTEIRALPLDTAAFGRAVAEKVKAEREHVTDPLFTSTQVAEQVRAAEEALRLELAHLVLANAKNAELSEDVLGLLATQIHTHKTGALNRTIQSAVAKATGELRNELEQIQVQLAGCGVAALGWSKGDIQAKPGDYGYSASYQDVLDLRAKWEALAVTSQPLKEKP